MASATDTSRMVLEFIHRLLMRQAADQPTLAGLLAELSSVFSAEGAGLASLPEGVGVARYPANAAAPSKGWPWQQEPSLLAQLRQPPGALALPIESGNVAFTLFTTPGGASYILWMERNLCDLPSEGELAALALAGQAVARWVDASDSSRWADQLERATRQQRLENAASTIRRLAHDFGNVLTGILGFTELALSQPIPANTPLHSYLQEVYRAAQTGAQFTHQLRLFSRRQSASSRPSNLAAVLIEQEARLFAAQPTGLNLQLDVAHDLPAVALDAEHLHQVLTALLDNAREALVGPGSISVSARVVNLTSGDCQEFYGSLQPGPHIEVIIADTGSGLSPEVQRKLFAEPFFTTKPRRRGFGLAVAYGILQAHRGGLRLHPGEEHGVVARLMLPLAPTATARSAREEAARPAEKPLGERILVVDDEPDVLRLVSTTLERAGYRVEAVTSAEAALQLYFAHPTDPFRLVLTDVVMPVMNGVELVRRLLRRDPGVRVLFMSGHVSTDFTQHDFANQAYELLAKPFRSEQLIRSVRAAIDRSGQRAATNRDFVDQPSSLATANKK